MRMQITISDFEEEGEMCRDTSISNIQSVPEMMGIFYSKFRVNGLIKTQSPMHDGDVDHAELLLRWLETNVGQRTDCSVSRLATEFHIQSSTIMNKSSNFRIFFEDETDAMLFYMTFK